MEQPYYAYSTTHKAWQAVTPSTAPSHTPAVQDFVVLSWNIDFRIPFGNERMSAALQHLQSMLHPDLPTIIFLQEMTNSDLELIQAQSWVRSDFYVTDVTPEHWASDMYGTCTLVPRSLAIVSVFRRHYNNTRMHRDGLFVDVSCGGDKLLRLCNTHLESLAAEPPRRPLQLQTAAILMHAEDVDGSVLGGDLNAIEAFDKLIAEENGLRDAYLENGGQEDHLDGYTWGQMAKIRERTRYGLSRMDKLLFCGNVQVKHFETFGYDVQIADRFRLRRERKQLVQLGFEKPWVTDHLGVKGIFSRAQQAEAQVDTKATRL